MAVPPTPRIGAETCRKHEAPALSLIAGRIRNRPDRRIWRAARSDPASRRVKRFNANPRVKPQKRRSAIVNEPFSNP
jgi:hypothetical protein